jgi:hypothetical protein
MDGGGRQAEFGRQFSQAEACTPTVSTLPLPSGALNVFASQFLALTSHPIPAMNLHRVLVRSLFIFLALSTAFADDWKPEVGFTSLFNGTDLTGWCFKTKAGEVTEKFDGKAATTDGRYSAKDGVLTVNPPVGVPRLVAQIWTQKEFPTDFVLKIEFRAGVNADSGIFIRKPQLQCRDYAVAGPEAYKKLKNYKPQDWNQIEVTVKDGVARCTCNGEVLEEAIKLPETGPIGLEGDRGQMDYRRIQLKELK